jgi:hypothetical protein
VVTIQGLLPQDTLIKGLDHLCHNDNEASYCIVLWARNPDEIAKEGVLRLEEIHDRPQTVWHFADPVAKEARRPHAGLVYVLIYEVIIHVDDVTDYRPSVTTTVDWPQHHSIGWQLGFRDDWTSASP